MKVNVSLIFQHIAKHEHEHAKYTHTHICHHTHTHSNDKAISCFPSGAKKQEKKVRKKTSSCVSAGGVGVVALCCCPSPSCMPTPLVALTAHSTCCDMKFTTHTHTQTQLNTHTQSARGNHLHLSSLVRTVENCRLPRSMHIQCLKLCSPPPFPTLPFLPCVFLSHRMIKISVRGLDKYFIKRPHNRY